MEVDLPKVECHLPPHCFAAVCILFLFTDHQIQVELLRALRDLLSECLHANPRPWPADVHWRMLWKTFQARALPHLQRLVVAAPSSSRSAAPVPFCRARLGATIVSCAQLRHMHTSRLWSVSDSSSLCCLPIQPGTTTAGRCDVPNTDSVPQ